MRIVLQFCNSYALEEFVYTAHSAEGQEETRDIRLPSDRFHLVSDPVISLTISSQGITFNENSSNVYFLITNKSTTYKDTFDKDTFLTIVTADREELKVFAYIGNETGMCFYQTERSRVISLGSSLDQSISCVDDPCLSGTHLLIKRSRDGGRINIKGREGIYLNERYVDQMESASLSCGDVIVAGGIRILWLDEYIGIEKLYSGRPCIVRLNRVTDLMMTAETDEIKGLKDFTPSPRNIIATDDSEIELDAPPPKQPGRNRPFYIVAGPALTMAVPMSLGCGIYIYSASNSGIAHASMYMYTGLITAVASAILGAAWAVINVRHEKKQAALDEITRVRRYKDYINKCERLIRDKYRYNINALLRNSPSLKEIFSNSAMLQVWNRRESDDLPFSYRLGVGSIPFDVRLKIPQERFSVTEDELTKLPGVLKRRYSRLEDVPVCTDIAGVRMQAFIGSGREIEELFLNMAVQIAATTGPELIRMVFAFSGGIIPSKTVRLMRWLPQAQGDDEHYVSTDRVRAEEILFEAETILRQPGGQKSRWMIFTDDSRLIPASFCSDENISILIYAGEYAGIPGECLRIIQNDRSYRGMIDLGGNGFRREICFDRITDSEAKEYVGKIAGIRLSYDKRHSPIPVKVSLPELFDAGMMATEYIRSGWNRNNTINSLRAPIGMGRDRRTVFLDLHEKGYGPHGLVAGMTGSGKSEMLQTLITSLAIRYSPRELGFFLIDYKGGGMARMFERLPHLLGSISNLSGNMIHRAMASIRSENERRQKIFLKAGVNSVRDYERLYISGRVEEALPHIIIIIDEFAELKREEPDFMKELISVAQVGRSLGVHLILATQKPAGTVDDNIFSNSRFRICLRVQDKQDSNDMLHRPDAAMITDPGRAFLQVGTDELFEEFQSAYTMEPFEEGNGSVPVYLLDDYGRGTAVFEEPANEEDSKRETHFSVLMELIYQSYIMEKMHPVRRLWLPPLKSVIALPVMPNTDTMEKYEVMIGRYDEPGRQRQDDYHHDLIKAGHTVVCGSTLSGKSTFLQTFIYSHILNGNPDDINIYIVDYSNGMLSCFRDSAVVGAYICEENAARLGNLFCMLNEIMTERRNRLEGVNFAQCIEEEDFNEPAILLVMDNYGAFREKTDLAYDKDMLELIKFGEAYGIFVMLTGAMIGNGDIPARLFESCRTGICLRQNDKYQYSECLREIRLPILPDDVKGRGLAHINGHILEFQTAVCCEGSDSERNRFIKDRIRELNVSYRGKEAMKVPYIPDEPMIKDLDDALSGHGMINEDLPVGYEAVSGKPFILRPDAGSCIVIAGREGSGKSNACMVISHYAGRAGMKTMYVSDIATICEAARKESDTFIICDGMIKVIDDFYRNYDRSTEEEFIDIIRNKRGIRMLFTIDPKDHALAAGRKIYEELKVRCIGIYLGGALDRQSVFDYSYLPYSEQCRIKPAGTGTVLRRSYNSYAGDIVIPCAPAA